MKFFQSEHDNASSGEIFKDDESLKREYLAKIADPKWVKKQVAWAEKQHQNYWAETKIGVNNTQKLVGKKTFWALAPETRSSVNAIVADTEVAGFAFLQAPDQSLKNHDRNLLYDSIRFLQGNQQHPATLKVLELYRRLHGQLQLTVQVPLLEDNQNSYTLRNPKFKEWLQKLGLEQEWSKSQSPEYWRVAQSMLYGFLADTKLFFYTTFLFDRVKQDLEQLIPHQSKIFQRTLDKTQVHIGKKSKYEDDIDGMHAKGDQHHLILEIADDLPDHQSFARDFLLTAHEYTHAVVEELLGIKSQKLANDYVVASLYGSIQESCAITIEQLLIQKHGLENVHKVFGERITNAKEIHHAIIRSLKGNQEVTHSKAPRYSEGVRFAIRLASKGWRPEHIPLLLQKVKEIVAKKTGDQNPEKLCTIPVSWDDNSLYQQILQELFSLRPPA